MAPTPAQRRRIRQDARNAQAAARERAATQPADTRSTNAPTAPQEA